MLLIRSRDFRDHVSEETDAGVLLDAEELFRGLHLLRDLRTETAKVMVMGQVEMAKRRNARRWLENAAYFATIMFTTKWVDDNISRKKTKPNKTQKGYKKPSAHVYPSSLADDASSHNKSPVNVQPSSLGEDSNESPKRSWREQRPRRPQSRSPETHRYRQVSPKRKSGGHRKSRRDEVAQTSMAVEDESRVRTHSTRTCSYEATRTSMTIGDESRVRTQGVKVTRASRKDDRKRRRSSDHRSGHRISPSTPETPKQCRCIEDESTQLTITVTSRDVSGAPLHDDHPKRRKKGSRKLYTCPMTGCSDSTLRLKWHILHQHAPEIFNEDLEPNTELTNRRYTALSILAKTLNGPTAQVEDLVTMLNQFQLISDTWEIQDNQDKAMRKFCNVMNWPMPESFLLKPMNSAACLIHWRALTALLQNLQNLSPNARVDFKRTFQDSQYVDTSAPVVEQESVQQRNPSPEPAPNKLAFDSHFHLDRLQWSLNLRQGTSFQDTMTAVGNIPEDYQVNLAGCTAVFCDMDFYPSPEKIDALALDSVSVAIGVHLKATIMTEDEEMKFIRTFSHPNVVALGEIGLDYTTHFMDWPRQERQFLKLLIHANARNVVVVLHLRGISTDPLARVVTLRGLALCAETLRKRQTIHLHCFSGPSDVVREWLKEFPNTYFGFTGMVRNFNYQQCEGLRAVPRDRLLLESDAPYFQPPKFYVNAPCLLGYTAELVADVRREKYEYVLSQTTANALRIYVGTVGDQ